MSDLSGDSCRNNVCLYFSKWAMCPDTSTSKQPPKLLHAAAHIGSQQVKSSFLEDHLWSQWTIWAQAVPALSAKAGCILGWISKNAASRPREVILPLVDTPEITSVLPSTELPCMKITSEYWSQSSKELPPYPRYWGSWCVWRGWGNWVHPASRKDNSRKILLISLMT